MAGLLTLASASATSHFMGSAATGRLFVVMGSSIVIGTLGALGLPDVAMRYVSQFAREPHCIKALLVHLSALVIVGALLVELAAGIIRAFAPAEVPVASMVAAPAVAACLVGGQALTGLQWARLGELTTRTAPQAIILVGIFAIPHMGQLASYWTGLVPIAYFASAAIAALVIAFATKRSRSEFDSSHTSTTSRPATPTIRRLARQGLPLLAVAAVGIVPQWLDVLLIQAWRGPVEAGVYAVASRAAALVGLVLVGASAISAPRFAYLHAQRRLSELRELAALVNTWSTVVAVLVAGAVLVVVHSPMHLFGGLPGRSPHLIEIATLTQLIHVGFGLVAVLLVMTGQSGKVLASAISALTTNVLLNLMLIPPMGAMGAAFAALASVFVANCVSAGAVWRTLGIRPFTLRLRSVDSERST